MQFIEDHQHAGETCLHLQVRRISHAINLHEVGRELNLPHYLLHGTYIRYIKKTSWSESATELYRPSDRRLSAK
jgi:hypothetical protein